MLFFGDSDAGFSHEWGMTRGRKQNKKIKSVSNNIQETTKNCKINNIVKEIIRVDYYPIQYLPSCIVRKAVTAGRVVPKENWNIVEIGRSKLRSRVEKEWSPALFSASEQCNRCGRHADQAVGVFRICGVQWCLNSQLQVCISFALAMGRQCLADPLRAEDQIRCISKGHGFGCITAQETCVDFRH